MNRDVFEEDIISIARSLSELTYNLEGKRMLITGGNGFLGKYMLATLTYLNRNILKKKCEVVSVDNNITSTSQKHHLLIDKNIKYLRRDVIKPLNIGGKVDYIIHAAGIASPVFYQKYPLETIDVAVVGVRNMLNLARKKDSKSFLYFSSSEIYGNPTQENIPTKEEYNGNVSCTGDRACYDESKRMGETLCMTYFRLYNTPIKMVRPFNVFGPGMNYKDGRVIPSFIYNALKGKSVPIHVSGKQTRTFCYISDATNAFFRVLVSGKAGEAYNVGSNTEEITINTLAQKFNKVFDNKFRVRHIPYPKNYPQDQPLRRCPDLSKIEKATGFRSLTNLEEGLKRMLVWSRQNW